MKKISFVLFLWCVGTLSASESSDSVSITISSKHASERLSVTAERVLVYLLGDRPSDEIISAFAERLKESMSSDDSVRKLVMYIDSSESSDTPEDQTATQLKKLVVQSVSEILKEKHLEATDARLQLEDRERALREQKYKMYAAFSAAITSVCGAITTLLAYNLS